MYDHKRTTPMQVTETNYTRASAYALTQGLNSEEEPDKHKNAATMPKTVTPLSAADRH